MEAGREAGAGMEDREETGEGQVRGGHPYPGHIGAAHRLAGRQQHRRGAGGRQLLPVARVAVEGELARAGLLQRGEPPDAHGPVPFDGPADPGGELCEGAFHPLPGGYFFLAGAAAAGAVEGAFTLFWSL